MLFLFSGFGVMKIKSLSVPHLSPDFTVLAGQATRDRRRRRSVRVLARWSRGIST